MDRLEGGLLLLLVGLPLVAVGLCQQCLEEEEEAGRRVVVALPRSSAKLYTILMQKIQMSSASEKGMSLILSTNLKKTGGKAFFVARLEFSRPIMYKCFPR